MAPAPSMEADTPSEDPEKPQSPDGNGSESGPTIRYVEPSNFRTPKEPAKSRRKRWKLPSFEPGQKTRWWFASTAIPLLAATLGPLANVLSIAALVTYWRSRIYIDGRIVQDFEGIAFKDPRWCYWLNVGSLICGFLGNLFLLLNFTQRVRYLIALPTTIFLWYLSTGFLIGITACMQIYDPPNRPYETYTQGYWYAVGAAAFYLVCSMILMVNMLGYFLGHYPDTFALSDNQRTLILQTMIFFIWLAGGAAVFSRLEQDAGQKGWEFADALYFCDVTILTVGFGDFYPTTNVTRGIVFPFSIGGIISLGLVISSIYKFMRQLGEENIIQRHVDRMRERTIEQTVTNSFDLRQHVDPSSHGPGRGVRGKGISAPSESRPYRTAMGNRLHRAAALPIPNPLQRRKPRVVLLREEKDRFEAMRRIQARGEKFRRWYALLISVIAFGILWCVGAVVFWQAEKKAQDMTYFEALYFCYVSLLTVGYGDLAPKSNAGRCFFFIWSLIAVPTMTILISDMGDTVVDKFKKWSNSLADFTVLPKEGIWHHFLIRHPWLLAWLRKRTEAKAAEKRLREGFRIEDPEADGTVGHADNSRNELNDDLNPEDALDLITTASPTLPALAREASLDALGHLPTKRSLSRQLALSIQRVASHLTSPTPKRYSYEEWVEFTRLIRYSSPNVGKDGEGVLDEEDEEGLVEWDWIGENSPMVSGLSESEWLLRRLCESLVRVERRRDHKNTLEKASAKEKRGVDHDKDEGNGLRDHRYEQDWAEERRNEVLGGEEEADAQNQVLASGANGI